ncbi:patatin-like phospholipase family protein [Candidatus Electronema sp. PJ]|uniref:patatin-like phospholipase family protein n=1 Tax=Candidatus Electronema sp. PJ TaxID=3401572 RepID=UPI003AA87B4D
MDKYTILSIDGGGIKGLIPAAVLVELEKMIQKERGDKCKIGECFDFIAGTSTGGILACLLLMPDLKNPGCARFSAVDAQELYLNHGDEIFDRSVWQIIATGGGLADTKYDAKTLEHVLKKYFKETTLKELIRPCLITGYDVRKYRPVFFTKHDADLNEESNFLVRDVARSTSAAPTYFEPACPESLDDIPNATPVIDGGVFANNPTACAYVEALTKGRGLGKGVCPEEIVILSLGTGRKAETITLKQCRDWGIAGWARPLINIFMEGVAQTVDYQMHSVFASLEQRTCGDNAGNKPENPKNYLRIDGEFGDYKKNLDIDGLVPTMDCATKDNMRRLCFFGKQLVENNRKELMTFVKNHLAIAVAI